MSKLLKITRWLLPTLLMQMLQIQSLAGMPFPGGTELSPPTASGFARIALRCVQREFPNKPDHVINDSSEIRSPRALHPSFYGCYDWHSSVHGHWMLIRLLRTCPEIPEASQIRAVMNENLHPSNVLLETAYLDQPGRGSFERTYGWAWLLKLAQELHEWKDPDARRWSAALKPLSQAIVKRYMTFLPKQNYPIRTGVHPNTAFGLIFALEYARAVRDTALSNLVISRSTAYFGNDAGYPIAWEPGGEDFFSPGLMEADLMRRILPPAKFREWFRQFAPDVVRNGGPPVFVPAVVTDRTDPKLVHLDGLNLSRAWSMLGIATTFPPGEPVRRRLELSAKEHEKAGLAYVASGNYEGEHWLATFAVLMLTEQ